MKILLTILLIYFGIKILSKYFGPLILKYFTKKAVERFGGQFSDSGKQRPQQQPQQKEGEISIDKMPKNKSSNKTVGEYVDYEEID